MLATKPITEPYPRIWLRTAVKFVLHLHPNRCLCSGEPLSPLHRSAAPVGRVDLNFVFGKQTFKFLGFQKTHVRLSFSFSFTLSPFSLSKGHPGHRSFEYETNILSCLFCQSTKYMYSCDTESLICISKNEAVR